MPYRRSNYRRGGGYRRGRVRRVGRKTQTTKSLVDGGSVLTRAERMISSGASTASTVAALARNVGTIMSMINCERKTYDQTNLGININVTPNITLLSGIAQGSAVGQRDGNSILADSICLKVNMTAGTAPVTFVRVILFVDKECDLTLPTVAELLENANYIQSPINHDNGKRFVILKTKVVSLNTDHPQVALNWFVKLPFHIKYDTSGGSITDCLENQVFFCMYSDKGAGVTAPDMNYYSRLHFYDN